MSSIAVVDDQSSRVQYYGQWSHDTLGSEDDVWDSTLSFAIEKGAGAVFTFQGTEVAVVGGILLDESAGAVPPASFVIDNGEPWTFTPPDSYNATWNNPLYDSSTLSDGPHTLNFTLLDSGSPWIVDLLLYNSTGSQNATATANAGPVTLVKTVFATPSRGATAAAGSVAAETAAVPVGAVVGGVVGGVVLLVCSALAFYFMYWKRRKASGGRPYHYHATDKADLFDGEDSKTHVYHYQRASDASTASFAQSTPRLSSYQNTVIEPYSPLPPVLARDSPTPTLNRIQNMPSLPRREASYATSAPSEYSASSMSRNTTYTVTNPDFDLGSDAHGAALSASSSLTVPAATLTPAERKAAEALTERRRNAQASVQQHTDSGYRFDSPGASGSGARHDAHADTPNDVPPVYSET
ncbi:hypothetical protein EIP86_004539 [Pleurotus ostreatoroseus]|nr:hypothetical protein EIP86_004539 [Pleurotus ostreatoroseus]